MKNTHIPATCRLGAALLATTALSVANPALAQEASSESDDGVIIVTAQKRAQNLQDVPIAITALGTEQLDELQVNELQDVVKFLPSVTIQSFAPGFAQVYFRGVASGENANHSASLPTVGTYLDEMPITTIQGALDIHAYDLARVEALAGPQGTLYGASSMAGTIKLVTNQPDYGSTYGAVDLELNSVAHGDIGGTAEGFVNLPLAENAALRVVGWYRHDAGYIDNIAGSRTYPTSGIEQDNAALVEEDYNDVDTYGARVALGIELDDNWTIRPTVMGQVQKTDGSFAQERSTAVNDDLQTVQYNPEYSEDKWLQAALTIEGRIGNWDLVATGGGLWREDEVASDYSDYAYFYDALAGYGAYFYDNNYDLISPNQYIEGGDRYRRMFGELRISSPQDNPLRVIAGVFAQRQRHEIEQHYIIDGLTDMFVVTGTDSNVWLTRQDRTDRDYAAFGEISYDLTDQLTLTGGARLYHYKNSLVGFFGYSANFSSRTGEAACFGPAVVDGTPCTNLDKTTSDTDAIFKLNATYEINPDVLVYATWSQGFRPGGINRRGTLPPYGSDTLDNYEIGWKTQFGPVRFNGAIYQEDWNEIQLSFLGENGLTEIRNAGIARIRGIEADFIYSEGGLTLSLSGSYNDAEIRRDFCRIANPDFDCTFDPGDGRTNALLAPSGTQLPVTAKFKGNAVARYEFPVGDWDAHVQGALAHIGKRRSDVRTYENSIKGFFDPYTTADFSLGVRNEGMRFELFATNLFDERGVVNSGVQCLETTCGDPDGLSGTGGVFYDYVIRPRVIGIKAGFDF
ncbi:TonB-dependent receptor [Alteraurantiacibacter aquimixticola]|uniref:TonB-dependent receptor n=1 Tax=Alteraurantiacibacter aquimixticola TaxID=2489173 RepID=A0A4T3F4W3_9SPHN|nr:TonB-dependent receptor [Alteraurantiacibacter aquimixticola]TIX51404.1 TonB-dependent receptor [Alteraurantiacibacter aquimixticola]